MNSDGYTRVRLAHREATGRRGITFRASLYMVGDPDDEYDEPYHELHTWNSRTGVTTVQQIMVPEKAWAAMDEQRRGMDALEAAIAGVSIGHDGQTSIDVTPPE